MRAAAPGGHVPGDASKAGVQGLCPEYRKEWKGRLTPRNRTESKRACADLDIGLSREKNDVL